MSVWIHSTLLTTNPSFRFYVNAEYILHPPHLFSHHSTLTLHILSFLPTTSFSSSHSILSLYLLHPSSSFISPSFPLHFPFISPFISPFHFPTFSPFSLISSSPPRLISGVLATHTQRALPACPPLLYVGGYLVLRFIAPYLVAGDAGRKAGEKARKSLLMITKLLQVDGNDWRRYTFFALGWEKGEMREREKERKESMNECAGECMKEGCYDKRKKREEKKNGSLVKVNVIAVLSHCHYSHYHCQIHSHHRAAPTAQCPVKGVFATSRLSSHNVTANWRRSANQSPPLASTRRRTSSPVWCSAQPLTDKERGKQQILLDSLSFLFFFFFFSFLFYHPLK